MRPLEILLSLINVTAFFGLAFPRLRALRTAPLLPAAALLAAAQELTMLATTEPLLFLPWAVRRTLPAKLREAIQTILVDLGKTDEGRAILKSALATGIGKADDKDYDAHRRMTNAVFGKGGAVR